MEYKRDIRDSRFYMVEPTVGRTDFQEEVATINGANLPYAAYCHELEQPLPVAMPANPQSIWRDAQIDRWSKEESPSTEDNDFVGLKVVDAYWRWGDPRPCFDNYADRLANALKLKFGSS